MNLLLLSAWLLLATSAPTQTRPKTPVKSSTKTVRKAPTKAPTKAAPALPTAALHELGRILKYQCSDAGNDYIRAFVYRAYMNAGAQRRYEIDEQLGQLASNKKSLDALFTAFSGRYNAGQGELTDAFYLDLGMTLTSAKTLGAWVAKHYPAPVEPVVNDPAPAANDTL